MTAVDALRGSLPQGLIDQEALVAEVAAAAREMFHLRAGVAEIISAIYVISEVEGWADGDVVKVVDSLPIRQADRIIDALTDVLTERAGAQVELSSLLIGQVPR